MGLLKDKLYAVAHMGLDCLLDMHLEMREGRTKGTHRAHGLVPLPCPAHGRVPLPCPAHRWVLYLLASDWRCQGGGTQWLWVLEEPAQRLLPLAVLEAPLPLHMTSMQGRLKLLSSSWLVIVYTRWYKMAFP